MKLALAGDHAGLELKTLIKGSLDRAGFDTVDLGTYSTDPVDYPDFASRLAAEVAGGRYTFGIVICGTGIGVSIAANKVPGVRAALCHDTFSARMARLHNNANVLALGSRVIGSGLALDIVRVFLETPFEGGRHCRRLEKIAALEKQ